MTLHDRLQAVFQEIFNDDQLQITDSTTAEDIPEWDSIAHINLMLTIESTFSVHFSDHELTSFANVGELERWLTARVVSVGQR